MCVGALCYGLMHYYSRLNANGLLDWFGVRPVASLLAIGLLLTLSIGDSIPGIESRIAEMLPWRSIGSGLQKLQPVLAREGLTCTASTG